jgi:hypothetical protein
MCASKQPVTNLQRVWSHLNYSRCNMDATSGNSAGKLLPKTSFPYYCKIQQTCLRRYKAM